MKHLCKVYDFDLKRAKAGVPLERLDDVEVEAPEDLDEARRVVSREVAAKTGRLIRGVSSLVEGGFSVTVMRDELKHAVR